MAKCDRRGKIFFTHYDKEVPTFTVFQAFNCISFTFPLEL